MIGDIEQTYGVIKNFGGSYYVRIPIELIKIRDWKEGDAVRLWLRNVKKGEEKHIKEKEE